MTDPILIIGAAIFAAILFAIIVYVTKDDGTDEIKSHASDLEDETRRLYGHVEILQNRLALIAKQETSGANATVRRMARFAREGMKK